MAGLIERFRRSIKGSLDRRYANHTQIASLETRLEASASLLGETRDKVSQIGNDMAALSKSIAVFQEVAERLERRVDQLQAATNPSVRFTGEALPEMKHRLGEAHRLANESARAIEEILQQELLIKRDLNALRPPEA